MQDVPDTRKKLDDYYGVLGLAQDATTAAIKKAYRKASLRYHPDSWARKSSSKTVVAAAEDIFKIVFAAYETLSKTETDEHGHTPRENYDANLLNESEYKLSELPPKPGDVKAAEEAEAATAKAAAAGGGEGAAAAGGAERAAAAGRAAIQAQTEKEKGAVKLFQPKENIEKILVFYFVFT